MESESAEMETIPEGEVPEPTPEEQEEEERDDSRGPTRRHLPQPS